MLKAMNAVEMEMVEGGNDPCVMRWFNLGGAILTAGGGILGAGVAVIDPEPLSKTATALASGGALLAFVNLADAAKTSHQQCIDKTRR